MIARTATALLASNALVRAGLASLLEKYSYRIVCSAASADDLQADPAPRLVIILADARAKLEPQATLCRSKWPESRIVALYDRDCELRSEVLHETIDGCIPASVSEHTLLQALDLVAGDGFFMLLRPHDRGVGGCPKRAAPAGPPESEPASDEDRSASEAAVIESETADIDPSGVPEGEANGHGRNVPKLSDRELQVLDGIARGLQNKMIARTYGITEATVKVHMKSILRKIQVGNRTQAAVWAMSHNVALLEARLFDPRGERSQH